ncbi:intraflagellar transport complex B protein 46 C terminal-domain-containing protein [Gaertneriomyces semiglobifer]|nr:intraflagellar transport complex B protein 46 C terminal-domain-containing protein [Gaertneriomyces semiglobifer]
MNCWLALLQWRKMKHMLESEYTRLQSDFEKGIDAPVRPYSALRAQVPTKSESNLTEVGTPFQARPLRMSQVVKSREHMSQNDLHVAEDVNNDYIGRSGAFTDLSKDEHVNKDETTARVTALKGGVFTSADMVANLPGSERDEAMPSEIDVAELGYDQPLPRNSSTVSEVRSATPIEVPRRATRPESARRTGRPTTAGAQRNMDDIAEMEIKGDAPRLNNDQQILANRGIPVQVPVREDSLHYGFDTDAEAFLSQSRPRGAATVSKSGNLSGASSDRSKTSRSESLEKTSNNDISSELRSEIEELFTYINVFKPQTFDLTPELKCFIPDYIPAIGDIDPLIKVPVPSRWPDGERKPVDRKKIPNFGITILDEPSIRQTDPAVLDLKLRALHKTVPTEKGQSTRIRTIDATTTGDGLKALAQWVQNMGSVNAVKPQAEVNYSKTMPDLERLMAQWPRQLDKAFTRGEIGVPPADINLSLTEYSELACAILDIPVHPSQRKPTESRAMIESLHVLFSLFATFKNSQHFGRDSGKTSNS